MFLVNSPLLGFDKSGDFNLAQKAMPNRIQIRCINKSDRYDAHERILTVGGFDNGQRWKITQQEAITYIENRTFDFYVNVNGSAVDVIVAISRFGHKYIKTRADGEQPNNLLSLPECP